MKENKGIIKVTVRDKSGKYAPIKDALVLVSRVASVSRGKHPTSVTEEPVPAPLSYAEADHRAHTDQSGNAEFELDRGKYLVSVDTFVAIPPKETPVEEGGCSALIFNIPVGFEAEVAVCRNDAAPRACPDLITAGTPIRLSVRANEIDKGSYSFRKPVEFAFSSNRGLFAKTNDREAILDTEGMKGPFTVSAMLREVGSSSMTISETLNIMPQPAQPITGDVSVTMRRTATTLTPDMALWTAIRSATDGISFNNYKKFMDNVMCGREPEGENLAAHCEHRSLPYPGVDAYSLVKCATEVFLMAHCGVVNFNALDEKTLTEEQGRYGRDISKEQINRLYNEAYLVEVNGGTPVKTLPYLALIRSRLGEVPLKDGNGTGHAEVANCFGILRTKLENPCLLELIWSYWHEEGMLVQTMKAISLRFQNRRSGGDRDPLMRFDVDPLRPLANLLWGYIQDEQHRLTLMRRGYEYAHHYDFTLQGRAVPPVRAVDSRSKFVEAFHNQLYLCSVFFKADDDTTVIADGFPVMNAIREVHLLLAEGAHNQFGDLPSTARQEMLIEQWLLARPEMREFLGGRIMVPYSEVWMDRVDTVKRLQGWTDATITDFHDLAVFGEQLLLSIRWGHWSDIHDPTHAANWARYWRPEIQSYIHSYRAVTGVDLTAEAIGPQVTNRDAQPSVHLRRRLDAQRSAGDAAGSGLPRQQGAGRNGSGLPRQQGAGRNGSGSPRQQGAGRNGGGQPASRAGGARAVELTEDF
jgi:hypothetical protein